MPCLFVRGHQRPCYRKNSTKQTVAVAGPRGDWKTDNSSEINRCYFQYMCANFELCSGSGVFIFVVLIFFMLWHRETFIFIVFFLFKQHQPREQPFHNPQSSRGIVVPNVGIGLTTFKLRQSLNDSMQLYKTLLLINQPIHILFNCSCRSKDNAGGSCTYTHAFWSHRGQIQGGTGCNGLSSSRRRVRHRDWL